MSADTTLQGAPVNMTSSEVMPTPSLRRNFTWTFFGNVIYSACQWGILVVLAKLGSPEIVGKYALGLAVTAPVMMFSQLQLRGVQATDAKREYTFGDYLALRLLTTALALAAVIGIAAFARYGRETTLVILVVGGMKGLDSLSDVYFGLWQQNERMEGIAKVMAVNGVVSVVALALAMWYTHSVVWAALASAGGSAVALAFALVRNRPMAAAAHEAPRPRWHSITLWRLARLAMPLGIGSLLLSLNISIPRFFVESHLGAAGLGVFAASTYFLMAGTAAAAALAQSSSSRLGRYYAQGNIPAFTRLLRQLIGLGMVLGLLGILVAAVYGGRLLALAYSPQYASAQAVFCWSMVGAAIGYVACFLNVAMIVVRRMVIQVPLFAAVTGTIALCCAWLVPKYGLLGAAWGALAGMLVHIVCAGAVVSSAVRRR